MTTRAQAKNSVSISALVTMLLHASILPACAQNNYKEDGSLCLSSENTVISFSTSKKSKKASVCTGTNDRYIVYRFGTRKDVEMTFPARQDKTSWSNFKFDSYTRGGGAQNDAEGQYSLDFDNDGVSYSIFQEWTVTPKNYSVGILVETNNKNLSIKGEQSTQIGSLSRLEGKNQISPSND
ncbi:hypothetical protein H9N23_21605 [Xanthomonas oryzae pv. oryzae]|nr:hypothetical protein [Xanthomonas oryzae]UAD91726.1 hypothetical protein H9N23_21605 [Xanthomonas oryzae pv. oryzae]UHC71357.1 hypothetical protein LUZ17_19820 [Xanthomonas oryzae pv. oryzae]URJ84138.1 hypothetical protein M9500_14310 [Xanthomonas oryzae pv. oryzae]